jgi:hypothetical protein
VTASSSRSAHDPRWLVELTAWIGRYGALAGIAFELTHPAPVDALSPDPLPVAASGKVRPPLAAPRITPITQRDQLAEHDRPVFDAVTEGRGRLGGPCAGRAKSGSG